MYAIRLFNSVILYLAMTCLIVAVVGGFLYVSRRSSLRHVTGQWVGVLTSEEGSADRRALLLDTAVSATHLFRPTLVGTLLICTHSGEIPMFLHETRTVSTDTLGVEISSTTSESSELFGALRGDGLTTVAPPYGGVLQRGGLADYHKACEQLQR